MNGMTSSWVIGAIRKAVSGEAACSTLCAKPNTRPWRWKGTTRCRIVCSDASAYGITHMNAIMQTASSTIEDRIGNTITWSRARR